MEPVARIATLFETFAPADVQRLGEYYRDDACFKDPFHEVRGLARIQRIFAAMFETMEAPRFTVTRRIADGREVVLLWRLSFCLRGAPQSLDGASHLRLDGEGMICWHRDYWDPAEGIYEKLPVLGALMRWIRRRAAGSSAR
ncbi:MAG: nuclear transport factor 2 family protein [Ramlibacter sp.]